jgi:23S rRNA (cytosine1962-C5)-methyltransferase
MTEGPLSKLLERSLIAREMLFDPRHEAAFRLFNGFTEGCPQLVVDLYGATVILNNYAEIPEQGFDLIREAQEFLQSRLAWLRAGIVKTRNGNTQAAKRGEISFGTRPDRKIKEQGIWYALDLTMNRDTSLYLDTRNLRKWAIENLKGKSVLNTFAYTGSLGVAAVASGASRVIQLDANRQFLNVAKQSYTLNGYPIHKDDFITADFFLQVGRFKRRGKSFDCVFIDPPYFATSSKGRVDQEQESARLINKVRPLINDGGYLVAINNALYVSGKDYLQTLESLCADGYLKIFGSIPVPPDLIGYEETVSGTPVTDPAPFNHSTKIAVLEVKRKSA